MFSALAPLLYVKVSPERLTVRDIKKGVEISEVPEMAITTTAKPIVLAVGQKAREAASLQSAKVVNPFAHPRTLISDFTVAEQVLKAFVKQLHGTSLFALAPRVLMHPLGSPAGGFTQVERRAFRELALGAGAAEVILWVGRELSDHEAQSQEVLAGPEGRE